MWNLQPLPTLYTVVDFHEFLKAMGLAQSICYYDA